MRKLTYLLTQCTIDNRKRIVVNFGADCGQFGGGLWTTVENDCGQQFNHDHPHDTIGPDTIGQTPIGYEGIGQTHFAKRTSTGTQTGLKILVSLAACTPLELLPTHP